MAKILNYGGVAELSTVDYFECAATVIFFRGCNYNCFYCQNQDIISGCHPIPLKDIKKTIDRTKRFVSAVVFSGGEPTLQSDALKTLATYAKSCGLKVGLQTNGYRPEVVSDLIKSNLLDTVFIDVKASLFKPKSYQDLVQIKLPRLTQTINKTIHIVAESDVNLEIRTTVFESIHTPEDIISIMQFLDGINRFFAGDGTFIYKVQIGRHKDGEPCVNKFDIEKLKSLIEEEEFHFSEIII